MKLDHDTLQRYKTSIPSIALRKEVLTTSFNFPENCLRIDDFGVSDTID